MKVIGHQKQINFLLNSAQSNFLSQVYLFYGQSSIGKKRVAIEFSKFIETKNGFKNETEQNIECKDIEMNRHPDFKIIHPQSKTEKGRQAIPIEEIKNLASFLDLKPLRAKYKIVVIDNAHLLNYDAQSALLKTLEEPRKNVIFFLITQYPQLLVSTILSRSSKLYFPLVRLNDIKDYIINEKKIDAKRADKIAFFSFGKPGLALNFLSFPQKIGEEKKSFEEFMRIVKSDLFIRFNLAKILSNNREEASKSLENWLKYFRLILLSHVLDRPEYLNSMGISYLPNFSDDDLIKIIQLLQKTKLIISTTNANAKLALENLLINI